MMEASRRALIVVDMQEDFCSKTGAYEAGGLDMSATRVIMPVVRRLIESAQASHVPQIGTLFTVFEDVDKTPLIAPHLLKARPFLREGGFRLGSTGREFSRELPQPSHTITKPRYSAFYQTPLDLLLKVMGVTEVAVCGITTNGGVAATIRDAHLRDIPTTVLSDAVASLSGADKARGLQELSAIAVVMSADEWIVGND